jgi:hypothetical protein
MLTALLFTAATATVMVVPLTNTTVCGGPPK